jgi:hypothetical protein
MVLTPTNAPKQSTSLAAVLLFSAAASYYLYRKQRSQWNDLKEEEEEALQSIIKQFQDLKLFKGVTVEEANKRRTLNYYMKARDAHEYNRILGVRRHTTLVKRREEELDRIFKYWKQGTKSHRTVIVMCDATTSSLLKEARDDILRPLNASINIETRGVWIPQMSMIPTKDMHVTVATPWWWHTMLPGNEALSQELASRFRQALVLDFHHPFQIELERIVLLGGKSLVALWRCIGHRVTEEGAVIYDRHGEGQDPFVKLRSEVVQCFTSALPEIRREVLTYAHRHQDRYSTPEPLATPTTTRPQASKALSRQNTIEQKTPGLGARDGFIHTTLCRLPLDCLSSKDIELEQIHRLCREATATYCGHRMVVSKFRFLETTGCGGESNPCVQPLFDETMEAPSKVEVRLGGVLFENKDLHVAKTVESRGHTIGAHRRIDSLPTTALQDLFLGDNLDTIAKEEKGEAASSVNLLQTTSLDLQPDVSSVVETT